MHGYKFSASKQKNNPTYQLISEKIGRLNFFNLSLLVNTNLHLNHKL